MLTKIRMIISLTQQFTIMNVFPLQTCWHKTGIWGKGFNEYKNLNIRMFTVTLRVTEGNFEQPKCPQTDCWLQKLRVIWVVFYADI